MFMSLCYTDTNGEEEKKKRKISLRLEEEKGKVLCNVIMPSLEQKGKKREKGDTLYVHSWREGTSRPSFR